MFDLNTKILIVDDMLTMRKMVMKSLNEMGFTQLTEAADGALAWEAAIGAEPDFGLIISDWSMPHCSGIELLKRIRNDSRFAKIPFILTTEAADQQQILEAAKAGVSSLIIKPFTVEGLREKIETVYKKFASPS